MIEFVEKIIQIPAHDVQDGDLWYPSRNEVTDARRVGNTIWNGLEPRDRPYVKISFGREEEHFLLGAKEEVKVYRLFTKDSD